MQINNQTVEKGYMTRDVADYFLKCERGTESPLLSKIEKVDELLYNITSQVSRVNATKNITEDEEVYDDCSLMLLIIAAHTDTE